MDISSTILDIFSQKITPINNYILIGDKNPENEIKSLYLDKLINKGKNKARKNSTIITYRSSPLNINTIHEENKNQIESLKKTPFTTRGNNLIENGNNLDKSIDKLSNKFLSILFAEGEYTDTNLNQIELSKEQMNKFKLPKNNKFIYSFNKLHPFSIFFGTKYNKLIKKNNELTLPAPYYIEKKEWCVPEDNSLNAILEGVKVVNNLGLMLDSPELKKKFSGIVSDIIFQLLRVPFGHHISLNIKIFEPKTVLSRYVKVFSYANTYLLPACNPKLDSYTRFKKIIAFLSSGLYICSKQLKPFNPFLGETFEGEFPNGAKIYVENVTHKPLVARFLLRYKKIYEVNGFWTLDVITQNFGSEMIIQQKGPINIKLLELNQNYTGHIPFTKAVNASNESKRAMLFFGNLICVDVKNKYKCWIEYNYNKEIFHLIRGCTMNYEFPLDYKYDFDKEWDFGLKFNMDNDLKENIKKTKMDLNYKIYEKISGSFIENLKIGNDIIWDINKNQAEQIKPTKHCIPSDGRYREDLIWLYRSFYNAKDEKEEEIYRGIGMKWKVMMEEFCRWERKRRADYKTKIMKKKK